MVAWPKEDKQDTFIIQALIAPGLWRAEIKVCQGKWEECLCQLQHMYFSVATRFLQIDGFEPPFLCVVCCPVKANDGGDRWWWAMDLVITHGGHDPYVSQLF